MRSAIVTTVGLVCIVALFLPAVHSSDGRPSAAIDQTTTCPQGHLDGLERYEAWLSRQSERDPFTIQMEDSIASPWGQSGRGMIAIVVNGDLYDSVSSDIGVYASDVASDGFGVEVYSCSGGTSEELRAHLGTRLDSTGDMTGVVLIGDLPIAWAGQDGTGGLGIFECDYFYMDLDGAWSDSDSNGIYDAYSGETSPEVFVGRITPGGMDLRGDTEEELTRMYLRKVHQYRSGMNPVARRLLSYVDISTWQYCDDGWSDTVASAFDSQVLVCEDSVTTAPDYEARLESGYQYVILFAHGGVGGHHFDSGSTHTKACDLADSVGLKANFLNLYSCLTGSFADDNYIAGWYIFADSSYGLVSLAKPTIGGWKYMSERFWEDLSTGGPFGTAVLDYIVDKGIGMPANAPLPIALSGDPTLQTHLDSDHDGILDDGNGDGSMGDSPCTGGDTADCDDNCASYNPSQDDTDSDGIGDACSCCGDIDADGLGSVTASDLTYLVTYMFQSGPPLPVPETGDVDGSGSLDINDVVYLTTYMFSGGPSPQCPNTPCWLPR